MTNKFVMYHISPVSNMLNILKNGLKPSLAFKESIKSRWGPQEPVVYITDSIERTKDYAEQISEYYDIYGKWAIFKIEYDEFPEEIHIDLLWGVPGTYYTTMAIPPEHISLIDFYDIE